MGSLYGLPTMWPLFVSFDSPVGSVTNIFSQYFLSVQRSSEHIFSSTVSPFSCTDAHLLLKILIFFPKFHMIVLNCLYVIAACPEHSVWIQTSFDVHDCWCKYFYPGDPKVDPCRRNTESNTLKKVE